MRISTCAPPPRAPATAIRFAACSTTARPAATSPRQASPPPAEGPRNGNPVRCLLDDGLPGRNIAQIGLAPFANTAAMHRDAEAAGIGVYTIAEVKSRGIAAAVEEALARLGHVEAI